MIHLIWAMTQHRVIGKNNKIPWHIKEDLLYYKRHTEGKVVFMGEQTYYSLKGYYKSKPLPYGKIYVASFQKDLKLDDAEIIHDATAFIRSTKEDIWVVGGASIYRLCLPYADSLYISIIKEDYLGDTYFPEIDFSKYKLTWENETSLVHYKKYERVSIV